MGDDLSKVRSELVSSKKKFEEALKVANSGGLTETEKKEKKALEKKLCEMEEELKQLEHLKNDNQRLRDENGALIRVISKLSKKKKWFFFLFLQINQGGSRKSKIEI